MLAHGVSGRKNCIKEAHDMNAGYADIGNECKCVTMNFKLFQLGMEQVHSDVVAQITRQGRNTGWSIWVKQRQRGSWEAQPSLSSPCAVISVGHPSYCCRPWTGNPKQA